jgi:hypothetical protein
VRRGLPVHQAGPREKVLIRPSDIDAFLTRRQANVPDLNAIADEVVRCVRNNAELST